MASLRRTVLLGLLGLLLALGACQQESIVEPIPSFSENEGGGNPAIAFYNGHVITMNPVTRVDEAILLRGDRIVATGASDRILQMSAPGAIRVDLAGRTIMPGFVDPHNHAFNDVFLGRHPDMFGTTYAEAQQRHLEAGTTTLGNANIWPQATPHFLTWAQSPGALRMRVSLYLGYNDICGVDWPEGWWQAYPPTTDPTAMLRIQGIKFFSDGGGAVTCGRGAFSWAEPTPDRLYMTAGELANRLSEVISLGYQPAIHTLGDLAADTVLKAVETVLGGGPNAPRIRMEHNRIIRPEQLPRYGELGVVPVVFGTPYTCEIIDGGDWSALNDDSRPLSAIRSWFDPWRALVEANPGLPVAWHSDTPFWPLSPVHHLWGLVTRNELRADGSLCDAPPWLEENGVSVEQALEMMTINSAYALGMDQAIGSLRPGKFADLIVLSDNPLTVDPQDLKDLDVLMTMVGGSIEHCADGQEALCPAPDLE